MSEIYDTLSNACMSFNDSYGTSIKGIAYGTSDYITNEVYRAIMEEGYTSNFIKAKEGKHNIVYEVDLKKGINQAQNSPQIKGAQDLSIKALTKVSSSIISNFTGLSEGASQTLGIGVLESALQAVTGASLVASGFHPMIAPTTRIVVSFFEASLKEMHIKKVDPAFIKKFLNNVAENISSVQSRVFEEALNKIGLNLDLSLQSIPDFNGIHIDNAKMVRYIKFKKKRYKVKEDFGISDFTQWYEKVSENLTQRIHAEAKHLIEAELEKIASGPTKFTFKWSENDSNKIEIRCDAKKIMIDAVSNVVKNSEVALKDNEELKNSEKIPAWRVKLLKNKNILNKKELALREMLRVFPKSGDNPFRIYRRKLFELSIPAIKKCLANELTGIKKTSEELAEIMEKINSEQERIVFEKLKKLTKAALDTSPSLIKLNGVTSEVLIDNSFNILTHYTPSENQRGLIWSFINAMHKSG